MANSALLSLLGIKPDDTQEKGYWDIPSGNDTQDVQGVGSAFNRLQTILKEQTNSLKLKQNTEQQRLDADNQYALAQALDTARVGLSNQDPASLVQQSQRMFAGNKSALDLVHAQELEEQNRKLSNVERFFSLTPKQIDAQVQPDGGLRSELYLDTATNTYRQRPVKVDENITRTQEIAAHYDVPEEAVFAKREQQQVLQERLQKQLVSDTRAAVELRNSLSRAGAWAEDRAKRAVDENSPLGVVQQVIKQTRGIPTATLIEMGDDQTISEDQRNKAKASVELRSQLAQATDEKKMQQFHQQQISRVVKKIQQDYATSPALVPKSLLDKNNKLDVNALQKHANAQARLITKIAVQEGKNIRLADLDHEYGPGGLYDDALNSNMQQQPQDEESSYGSFGFSTQQ